MGETRGDATTRRALPMVGRNGLYDVAIVGGGPAGATCGAFCAMQGLRSVILERSRFPRDKVCGDCLNPAVWPILERLGAGHSIKAAPHVALDHVEFFRLGGKSTRVEFERDGIGEIAIRRSILDAILLEHARSVGAEVREDTRVLRVENGDEWLVESTGGALRARYLVAADGRNSTIARQLGLMPSTVKDRIGLQTHIPFRASPNDGNGVSLRLRSDGYCGVAPVDKANLNVCLVAFPARMPTLRSWAEREFGIQGNHLWRTITPLSRSPIPPVHGNLILIGDAARVVEPFTGEGIFYGIATGELAAESLARGQPMAFSKPHALLYSGRLWVNRLAKWAVLNPRVGSVALETLSHHPKLLRYLTSRIVRREHKQ